jgi:hypothetical protein
MLGNQDVKRPWMRDTADGDGASGGAGADGVGGDAAGSV